MLKDIVRSVIMSDLLLEGTSLDEAIPELTRGARTPYKQFTDSFKQVATFDRRYAFELKLQSIHNDFWESYLTSSSVWYREGSGFHWVGAIVFAHAKTLGKDGFDHFYVKATLQKSRGGWATAENKVLRWMNAASHDDEIISTGAGSLEFVKWLFGEVKIFVRIRQEAAKQGRPSELSIGWADEKRKRVYSWLTRLGFVEGVDSFGDSAYVMLFPSEKKASDDTEPE